MQRHWRHRTDTAGRWSLIGWSSETGRRCSLLRWAWNHLRRQYKYNWLQFILDGRRKPSESKPWWLTQHGYHRKDNIYPGRIICANLWGNNRPIWVTPSTGLSCDVSYDPNRSCVGQLCPRRRDVIHRCYGFQFLFQEVGNPTSRQIEEIDFGSSLIISRALTGRLGEHKRKDRCKHDSREPRVCCRPYSVKKK